ncbi:hypothetical protein GLYMA_10G105933v4 [Glycine max]|nr:hypothetical protein GLYMA_10G105933v4 [Glycine max]KAG4397213.1 hypothetical protein GLYMA_10G105933v4 [Glycine max]
MQALIWIILKGGLPTNALSVSKGMNGSDVCKNRKVLQEVDIQHNELFYFIKQCASLFALDCKDNISTPVTNMLYNQHAL